MASCRVDLPVLSEVTRKRGRIRVAVIEMFGSLIPIRKGNLEILDGKKKNLAAQMKTLNDKLRGIRLDIAASRKQKNNVYVKIKPLSKDEREGVSKEW